MSFTFNPFSKDVIDNIQEIVSQNIPNALSSGLLGLQADLEQNVRAAIEANLKKLNLVTREEFDIQQQVLLRTREKLEALEAKVAEMEKD